MKTRTENNATSVKRNGYVIHDNRIKINNKEIMSNIIKKIQTFRLTTRLDQVKHE